MKSLKAKVLLFLLAVFILLGGVNYAIQEYLMYPTFVELENMEAHKDADRALLAIKREIYHLKSLCGDWAGWDDTYEYIENRNGHFVEVNLTDTTFVENKLCLIYFINLKGEVVWGKGFDFEEEADMEFVEFPSDRFPLEHPLLQHKPDKDGDYAQSNISGILNSRRGPMLLSSQPILTSDNEGPPRGTLMFGRLFNKALLETLAQQTQVNFKLHPIDDSLPAEMKGLVLKLHASGAHLIRTRPADLSIFAWQSDISEKQGFLIEVKASREGIQSAVKLDRPGALRSPAHTLKSSCRSLGVGNMECLCLELEQMAKVGQLNQARNTVSLLKEEYRAVHEELTHQMMNYS